MSALSQALRRHECGVDVPAGRQIERRPTSWGGTAVPRDEKTAQAGTPIDYSSLDARVILVHYPVSYFESHDSSLESVGGT